MSRLQLAIDVGDLDEAVDFYSSMFGTGPAKVRPGYANFAIEEPPLKLVLFEKPGAGGTINHLGVEVGTATECCYAEKTETWLEAPDNLRWEWYVKTADSDQMASVVVGRYATPGSDTTCCD